MVLLPVLSYSTRLSILPDDNYIEIGSNSFIHREIYMTDWTSGYVADIGYTFGYYNELNPLCLKLAFLNAGLALPEVSTACELGYGQGLSINLHATGSAVQWHGTDFNPSQAGFARELAGVSGASCQASDDSFIEYASRPDLPDFDYIGLHGIWSWISDENRAVIVEFVRRKLKVGGVLYISYNTLPGWANFAPMRHLMTEHAEIIGAEGSGILHRINGALEFADKMLALNPAYAQANPQATKRLKMISAQNRHYLAHEYFNRDWHPMHFANMADWLEGAKVQYACSAHLLDHVEPINLTPDQQQFLKDIPDSKFRESVRDFMVNQQFRRDYWVKGARRLNPLEQLEGIRALRVLLVVPRKNVELKVTGALGEAQLHAPVYDPILDFMQDHQVRTVGDIEKAVIEREVTLSQLIQALLILVGAQKMSLVQDDTVVDEAARRCEVLNMHLIGKARHSAEISYLASPLTGGGVALGRFQQLFLLALKQDKKKPIDWAEYAWQLLRAQGQKIVKDGVALQSDDDNKAQLLDEAKAFSENLLPILKALKVA